MPLLLAGNVPLAESEKPLPSIALVGHVGVFGPTPPAPLFVAATPPLDTACAAPALALLVLWLKLMLRLVGIGWCGLAVSEATRLTVGVPSWLVSIGPAPGMRRVLLL